MASRVSVHCSAARAYGPLRCLSFDLLSAVSVALRPSAGRERRRRHVVRDDVRCGAVEVQPSTCKARDMLTRPFHHHPSRLPVCPRTRTTTFRSSKNFKFFFSPGCACASKTRTIFPFVAQSLLPLVHADHCYHPICSFSLSATSCASERQPGNALDDESGGRRRCVNTRIRPTHGLKTF